MKTFDTIADARDAIIEFRFNQLSSLSEDLQARFRQLAASPSPVDQIVGVMELLYANQTQLNDAGKELVGSLAAYATINAWHGLADDERGSKIVQAMGRDLGEKPVPGFKAPKPETDPAARQEFVIKPKPELPADETPAAKDA